MKDSDLLCVYLEESARMDARYAFVGLGFHTPFFQQEKKPRIYKDYLEKKEQEMRQAMESFLFGLSNPDASL